MRARRREGKPPFGISSCSWIRKKREPSVKVARVVCVERSRVAPLDTAGCSCNSYCSFRYTTVSTRSIPHHPQPGVTESQQVKANYHAGFMACRLVTVNSGLAISADNGFACQLPQRTPTMTKSARVFSSRKFFNPHEAPHARNRNGLVATIAQPCVAPQNTHTHNYRTGEQVVVLHGGHKSKKPPCQIGWCVR